MKSEDIEKLVEILADRAEAQDGYLKSLAERANLPKQWRGEISWNGASIQDARILIKESWSRGDNKEDPRFSSLGSILHIVWKEDVGADKGIEIAILIIRYNLYKNEELLRELKEDRGLLEQLNKIYGLQDYSTFNTKISNNIGEFVPTQARDELIKILKKIIDGSEEEIGLSSIKDACRKALPKSQRHHALSIYEIEQALNLLDKYPSERDGIPRILQFASHLSNDRYIASDDSLVTEIHQEINRWFEINAFENPSVAHQVSLQYLEPRLFVAVEERMTIGLMGGKEQLSVQAWLVPHFPCVMANREIAEAIYKADEYYTLDLSYLFSIYSDEISSCISNNFLEKLKETQVNGAMHVTNLSLSLEELKELLSLFLSEAMLLLTEEDPHNERFEIGRLAIELFLPERLLSSSDVDKWIVSDIVQKQEYSPIGAKFKVLLHNLARFTKRQAKKSRIEAKKAEARNILQENLWKVNWRLAMEKIQSPMSTNEFVIINADSDIESLQSKLERRIGVVLGQTPQRDEVLKSIITKAGIPIVLWTRHDDLEVDHSNEMHELVRISPLINLPERVLDKRREATANKQLVSHLGHHLTVLWDDPNRFPPSNDNLRFPL